ncbi:MAG: YtxH domain-containing protein [Bacteroidetes bacterium]|nr:MAG: YtxH domain-containing protein [Bacteroidota bacterium]
MNTGKVALSILAALAAGAALGILFAPDKGSITRRKIANKGKRYVDDVKEKYNEIVDEVVEKLESIKQSADDLIADGKEKMTDLRKEKV